MLSIAIHHNIWLTRDQRYAIHDGAEIVVVGVSIPVWVHNNKVTSEPAKEVFCKYYLKNPKQDSIWYNYSEVDLHQDLNVKTT